MMWLIEEELHILFCFVWTGCVVYGIYAAVEFWRIFLPHRDWMISVEDFIYWVFISYYIFQQVFIENAGKVRWYICGGMLMGIWSIHIIWKSFKKILLGLKKRLVKKMKKSYD